MANEVVRVGNRNVQPGVTEYKRENFVEQFDTAGGQTQRQQANRDSKIFPNLSHGFGRNRIASDSALNPDEYRRFLDSTCDTRFAGDIRTPIRSESTIHSGLEVLRATEDFKSDLHGFWEDTVSADLVVRTLTGSTLTWGGGGTVISGATSVALDMIAHKTHLVVLYASTNDHITERSTDGITWSAAATPLGLDRLSNVVTANEDIDAGLLAEIGGEIVAILWDEGAGNIVFESDPDVADTWAVESGIAIASGNGPQGVAVMPGIDNEDKLLICLREGLYEIDTAPSTWTSRLIFKLVTHNDNGRRMVVHSDGALYFQQGVSDDDAPIVYRMFTSDGARRFEVVPNDLSDGDGVVTEMLGPIRAMTSSGGFLYASIGGGKAARQARIICHNGKGWHSMHRHVVANQQIEPIAVSSEDDGTPRLVFAIRTATDITEVKFLGQPDANPRSSVTINREDSGFIDLPFLDGGMPSTSAAWLRIAVNAEDLSATTANEWINVQYGKDGEARTANDPGDILSGTSSLALPSGSTAGKGEQSVALGVRLTLNRDNTIVAFDATSTGTATATTTVTVSHVVGSGSNRVLIVGVSCNHLTLADTIPTGVTYDSATMTLFSSASRAALGSNDIGCSMWYLAAPNTGTANIVATFNSNFREAVVGGVSVTGARQTPTGQPGAVAVVENTGSTSTTVSLLSGPDDFVVDVLCLDSDTTAQAATVGAGQTQRWNTDNDRVLGAGSTEAGADGTTTMSWSGFTASRDNIIIACSIAPVGDTDTPKLFDTEVRYLKQPANLEGFRFLIDLDQTAKRFKRSNKNVYDDWKTAVDLGTLNAFEWGDSGNKYVKVHSATFVSGLRGGGKGGGVGNNLDVRSGFIEVDCSEVDA